MISSIIERKKGQTFIIVNVYDKIMSLRLPTHRKQNKCDLLCT